MTAAIALIAGVLGVGLAASQLIRLKAWLNRPVEPMPEQPGNPDEE